MALYTLADLHLSTDVDKPMDIFGGAWRGYQEKLRANLSAVLREEDTLVIPGDLSWGINLREALGDFRFLTALPGKKILVKGNHDLWWETVSKMERFFTEHEISGISFLHNNYHFYESEESPCAVPAAGSLTKRRAIPTTTRCAAGRFCGWKRPSRRQNPPVRRAYTALCTTRLCTPVTNAARFWICWKTTA